jgi:hypothetical protein
MLALESKGVVVSLEADQMRTEPKDRQPALRAEEVRGASPMALIPTLEHDRMSTGTLGDDVEGGRARAEPRDGLPRLLRVVALGLKLRRIFWWPLRTSSDRPRMPSRSMSPSTSTRPTPGAPGASAMFASPAVRHTPRGWRTNWTGVGRQVTTAGSALCRRRRRADCHTQVGIPRM